MHMADALISPAVGATFWTGSLVSLALSARKIKSRMDEKLIPLMGVFAAFIFAVQMINFTIPGTGSSGHIGGGMILAVTLGPYAGFIALASVLIIQSLFFADGGILALGCNIWNLGVYPCFIAFPLIYRKLVAGRQSTRRIMIASIISAIAGLQLGALSVAMQTVVSGRSELTFFPFSAVMLSIHLAIGLIEGFVTGGVINYIRRLKPEVLHNAFVPQALSPSMSLKKLITLFIVLSLLTAGIASWFASSHPDGLEWSIQKITGRSELHGTTDPVSESLASVQEKTALLPDYRLKNENGLGNVQGLSSSDRGLQEDLGTSLSGIVGSLIVFCSILVLGVIIKIFRRKDRYGRHGVI